MDDALAVRLSEAGEALEGAITDPALRLHARLVREVAHSHLLRSNPPNPSGITPLAFKVLIKPDDVDEAYSVIKTADGKEVKLYKPVEAQTKEEFATTSGIMIAASGSAFSHVTDEEWGNDKPKVGDRVVFTKYAGFRRKGEDGVDYLIVKGEDIHARL